MLSTNFDGGFNVDLNQQITEYNEARRAEYDAVMASAIAPPLCFTCKAPSTHVTTGITPGGYHAWQCDKHTPKKPAPLWGSDPGWQVHYEPIEEARLRHTTVIETVQ